MTVRNNRPGLDGGDDFDVVCVDVVLRVLYGPCRALAEDVNLDLCAERGAARKRWRVYL